MKRLFILMAIIGFFYAQAWAGQTLTSVSCDSATVGKQVVSSIGGGVVVTLPSNAAVAVWIARAEGTCSTTMTSISGVRITAGNGYEFSPKEDQYGSQLCCLLESGVTPVTAYVNSW